MLSFERIKSVVSNLGAKYGIKSAYLFGSYAKGRATEKSDVDIVIEKGRVQTYAEYADFQYEVSNALGVDVDLLTTDGIKPRFYDLIKNDMVFLYGA